MQHFRVEQTALCFLLSASRCLDQSRRYASVVHLRPYSPDRRVSIARCVGKTVAPSHSHSNRSQFQNGIINESTQFAHADLTKFRMLSVKRLGPTKVAKLLRLTKSSRSTGPPSIWRLAWTATRLNSHSTSLSTVALFDNKFTIRTRQ